MDTKLQNLGLFFMMDFVALRKIFAGLMDTILHHLEETSTVLNGKAWFTQTKAYPFFKRAFFSLRKVQLIFFVSLTSRSLG